MPPPFLNEASLRGCSEVSARGDEEGAASHRRIEHPQPQNLLRGSIAHQRVKRSTHDGGCDGAWRIERSARLPCIASAGQNDRTGGARLVREHSFVNRAKLFYIEITVRDRMSAAIRRRTGTDGEYRTAHDLVGDPALIECCRMRRREETPVEGGHLELAGPAARMREPGYRQDRIPDATVTPPRQKCRHYRADGVLVAIDWMPDRHETSCFGE